MNYLTRHDPINDLFRGFFVRPVQVSTSSSEALPIKLDITEQESQFVIHADIPGVSKEEIQVHIDGPVVSLSAERRQHREIREGERVLRSERYLGKFARTFQLGQDIDEAGASARYTDGVLELLLPKKATVQARRVTIQ
jgi:HSP20 family protein